MSNFRRTIIEPIIIYNMKSKHILLYAVLSIIIVSCETQNNEALFNTEWELEYISGPRIAFDGLYPDRKPQLRFNEETNRVEGNNSCNGYSADYEIDGNSITFGEPGPSTLMYCGEGETVFLNMVKKINKFQIDEDGKLNLMLDDVTMMRFHKME